MKQIPRRSNHEQYLSNLNTSIRIEKDSRKLWYDLKVTVGFFNAADDYNAQ